MKEVIWISLIGAGLVIGGLVLLWFLMDALVRVTATRKREGSGHEAEAPIGPGTDDAKKRKAAAAAVAFALARSSLLISVDNKTSNLTAWQSANRSRQLNNHPHSVSRKRKGK